MFQFIFKIVCKRINTCMKLILYWVASFQILKEQSKLLIFELNNCPDWMVGHLLLIAIYIYLFWIHCVSNRDFRIFHMLERFSHIMFKPYLRKQNDLHFQKMTSSMFWIVIVLRLFVTKLWFTEKVSSNLLLCSYSNLIYESHFMI